VKTRYDAANRFRRNHNIAPVQASDSRDISC
jgi:hypothetical protein